MNGHNTDEFERKARALYRQSCHALPPQSRKALQGARLNAIATRPRGVARRMLMPAGALAASALALVIGWSFVPQAQQATLQANRYTTASTHTPDSDNDNAELYQDLEFYRWLAAQDEQSLARN